MKRETVGKTTTQMLRAGAGARLRDHSGEEMKVESDAALTR